MPSFLMAWMEVYRTAWLYSSNTLVKLGPFDTFHLHQIINALEEDPAAQKMQLAFRLQQIAAALENKVTDL